MISSLIKDKYCSALARLRYTIRSWYQFPGEPLSLARVSTDVGDGLKDDISVRSIISWAYFFCDRKRLHVCPTT